MDFVTVLGVVGSVASLVGLFLPAQSRRQRAVHVIYGLSIVAVASFAVHYQQKLSRVNAVEASATRLITDRRMNFSDEGFVQASLAFLEKNKDLYPDSYGRAQEICKQHQCLASPYANDGKDSLRHAYGLINAASAMEGCFVVSQKSTVAPNNSINRTPKKLRFLGSLCAVRSGAGYVKR